MAASFRNTLGGTASSFSRTLSSHPSPPSALHAEGIRRGPNGSSFISSGIPDLDRILGGGFLLGSIVMIAEDPEAPHHLLLLRNFMSQGLVHNQPLLFASPSKEPRDFLGTLPGPMLSSQLSSGEERRVAATSHSGNDEKSLRIAWQYKKYFGEQQPPLNLDKGNMQEYCCDFDLRKPLDRQLLSSPHIECISLLNTMNLSALRDQCSKFLNQFSRLDGRIGLAGRIAIQSLCAPQCNYSDSEWEMLSFLRYLRAMIRSCNAVAVVTFPCSVLTASSYKRWQHLADTLLAIRAIPDEDKELAKLLTGYQDMIGFLHIHSVAQINTQVPVILETSTYSLKLHKRRSLVLERLNQAPVDGSSGKADATDGSCSGSSRASPIDF